jgi:PAS domain S-box-containing protein
MKTTKTLRGPLKSWDIYSESLDRQAKEFTKNTEIAILNEFKTRYNWEINVENILNNNAFEAIVLTNTNQEIEWVNKGFVKMSGYPVNFSKGKQPKFLQGEASSKEALNTIRKSLIEESHVKERVINYRKNGEQYICDIEIFPIRDKDDKLSHLLALEKEVY